MGKKTIALYPGTFDGLTFGHLDIIRRSARVFEQLFVAIAYSEDKNPLFTVEDRLHMLREETANFDNVQVTSFHGLTIDYAEKIGALVVIRGIRIVSDFEYELQMALMNRVLNRRVETLFMFPEAEHLYISSSLIKEVLRLGGDVSKFVPPTTEQYLREQFELSSDND